MAKKTKTSMPFGGGYVGVPKLKPSPKSTKTTKATTTKK